MTANPTRSELLPPTPSIPAQPAVPAQTWQAAAAVPATKSRVTAAALAIFLGSFGAHKFYMRQIAPGILYLVFFWAYIPGFLGWIEGMRYLAKSDEAWAAEHGWPVQRASGAAIAILWLFALLPLLAIAGIVALLFLGGQTSSILNTVGSKV